MRRLAQRFYDFWWGTGVADDVPALTYYLVLSLAPFALGLAAIAALLLESRSDAVRVADQVNRYLPADIHGDVVRLVTSARSDSPQLLLLALVAMLWTTSGAIGVVERTTSRILAAERHSLLPGRLRNMALGLMVGLAVVGSVAAASSLSGLADPGFRKLIPDWAAVAANVVGAILLFAIIFRSAPKGHLRWRAAFLGAIPTGILLQTVPTLVGLYVRAASGYSSVRLFLLLAVILLGLNAMATIILGGAAIAALRQRTLTTRALAQIESRRAAARSAAAVSPSAGLGSPGSRRRPEAGPAG